MTDKDTLLNGRKKMGWAGWKPNDERSKNDFKCQVVDQKGEAQKEGLEMIQKHCKRSGKEMTDSEEYRAIERSVPGGTPGGEMDYRKRKNICRTVCERQLPGRQKWMGKRTT